MQVRNRLLQRAHLGRRDTDLPAYQQGLKVLGTPLGTNEFVAVHLHTLSAQHRIFLELLRSPCPRAQYILRAVPPALIAVFAAAAACCIAWLWCSRSALLRRTRCPTSLSDVLAEHRFDSLVGAFRILHCSPNLIRMLVLSLRCRDWPTSWA